MEKEDLLYTASRFCALEQVFAVGDDDRRRCHCCCSSGLVCVHCVTPHPLTRSGFHTTPSEEEA